MIFTLSLTTNEVTKHADWNNVRSLPDIRENGQHYQLLGHAIAEIEFGKGTTMRLFHPYTPAWTGHVDIYVTNRNGYPEITNYGGHAVDMFDLGIEQSEWPSGIASLLTTILAIEDAVAEELQDETQRIFGPTDLAIILKAGLEKCATVAKRQELQEV